LRKHGCVIGLRLEVNTLSQLPKVVWAVDCDWSETKQKDHDDDDDVCGGGGGERTHREAGGVRELGRGENRTWAV
jgi:hypothetical protein